MGRLFHFANAFGLLKIVLGDRERCRPRNQRDGNRGRSRRDLVRQRADRKAVRLFARGADDSRISDYVRYVALPLRVICAKQAWRSSELDAYVDPRALINALRRHCDQVR